MTKDNTIIEEFISKSAGWFDYFSPNNMELMKGYLSEALQKQREEIGTIVYDCRLICSAEQNNESKEGCDCARYNEAIDEVLFRLRKEVSNYE